MTVKAEKLAEAFADVRGALFDPATGETSPADPRLMIGEITDDGRIVVPASLPDCAALDVWLDGWRCANRANRRG